MSLHLKAKWSEIDSAPSFGLEYVHAAFSAVFPFTRTVRYDASPIFAELDFRSDSVRYSFLTSEAGK